MNNEKLEPLISIITIVFNGEKYLENTIKSVMNQTYKNIEYIIIDGGSTDKTIEIIEKYDTFIDYWISEKDRGISDAFNKGIEQATGDIIGMINSDDWYELNTCEIIASLYHKADIIHGSLRYWNNKKQMHTSHPNQLQLMNEMTLNHPTVFVKKKIYDQFGKYSLEYKYAMDFGFLYECYIKGVSFYDSQKLLSNMRLDGISDKYWYKSILETYLIKSKHKNKIMPLFYLVYQLSRSLTSRILEKIGLKKIVLLYRNKLSIMRKQ